MSAVVSVAVSAAASGSSVLVASAAGGVSAAVPVAVPSARVFAPSFAGRGALPARAAACVRALAASPSPLFVCAPVAPCPAGLLPARRWVSCGSGSWAEVALAFGLGVPVLVVASAGGGLPSSPAWGSPLAGRLASGFPAFLFVPAAAAPRLPGF